jgi:F-type H+-transporting ATPase subunit b
VSPALANFLFEVANFLILAAILGRLLFKPVRNALAAERERVEKQKEEGQRLQKEADALKEKAQGVRAAAERDAEAKRQEILAGAKKEAEGLLEKARKIQREERDALDHELEARRQAETAALVDTVGTLAGDAVRALLSSLPTPSLDTALVEAACQSAGELPADSRKSATVESARALTKEQRDLLKKTLGDGFEERVVPELGAGVRLTTPAGQIDASVQSVARQAARAVREAPKPAGATAHPSEPRRD